MKRTSLPFTLRVLATLTLGSLLSVLLLLVRIVTTGNLFFSFMFWNLFLAWLPLLFALGLRLNLTKKPWLHWQNIGLTLLWLGFLPNSFYMMSDLIHIQLSGEAWLMYDVGMLLSFVLNGMILGFMSIYIVHMRLLKRMSAAKAHIVIGLVFLASGFAIYLGRFLRWNTWDVIVNPTGILFDLSERVINPLNYTQTFVVTFVYAAVIAGVYAAIYEFTEMLREDNRV